jgi:tRNA A37 threonylcarbamoyladenosine biosynthesis protein TsaE
MTVSLTHESLMYAVYFAPRGKKRLLNIRHNLGQRHLSPLDKLIAIIGDAGSGKTTFNQRKVSFCLMFLKGDT